MREVKNGNQGKTGIKNRGFTTTTAQWTETDVTNRRKTDSR